MLPPDPVATYSNDVLSGRILTGQPVRLACERHLRDLSEGSKRGLHWDLDAALRIIRFFAKVLHLPESNPPGQPFVLQPWQEFIVGSLFGWKRADGSRRFRTAYNEVGKGGGKTPMAAGIGLYMLAPDGEPGAECYAAATRREQANICFQDAVKMVEASEGLSAHITKSGRKAVYNLLHRPSNSFFRPVSSEHKGLDGKRVHYAAVDELHEHPTPQVVQKMRAGTKGRRQALIFEITNSGFDRHSICWHHHQYSLRVLEGAVENDSWFAYVCQLDPGDDWRDPQVWLKTNPNLGVSITERYLVEQVKEAVDVPINENIVKRLNFCLWTEQSVRWLPMDAWRENGGVVNEDELKGRPCFGGLDLSRTRDLTALAYVFPPAAVGEKVKILLRCWIPEATVHERARRDGAPYDQWVKQGFAVATPGNVVDYKFIRAAILADARKFDIREIAFDRTFAGELVTSLQEEFGENFMVEHGQGFLSMASPTAELERAVLGRELNHGDNPILTWAAGNASVRQDPAGNIKPDKEKSTERIDPIVALAMGNGRMRIHGEGGSSIYETEGLTVL